MNGATTKTPSFGRVLWQHAAAFACGAGALCVVVTGMPWVAGNDSPYHIRMALMQPSWDVIREFPWLHWTLFQDEFVSHHYGFHFLLSPFVTSADRWFANPLWGAKCAAILCMGLTSLLIYRLLRRCSVPGAGWWLAFMICLPWQFWLRQSNIRAPLVALPLLILALHLNLRGRWFSLALLAFLFGQVYAGAVLFPIIPIAVWLAAMMCRESPRESFRCMLASAAGLAASFVINPYFPQNLSFMYTQLFQTGLAAPDEVGSEWQPYDSWYFLTMCAPLWIVLSGALLARLRAGMPLSRDGMATLLVSLGFLVLTLKARRFIEYWPPFALISAAMLAKDVAFDAMTSAWCARRADMLRTAAATFVIVVGGTGLYRARSESTAGHNVPAIAAAMDFLKSVSSPGARVLTDDWDVFPVCFYFNTHNTYCVGLDPQFTQSRFPHVWDTYRDITRGGGNLGDINDLFGAEFVLVCDDHAEMYRRLLGATDQFELLFPRPVIADTTADKARPDASTQVPPCAVFAVKSR